MTRYDAFGAPITETVHEIKSTFYEGGYGERPTPWQRCYECVCGEDLGFDEEGAGSADVEGAFEAHLAEVDPDTADCGDSGAAA